jgi:hypothetical protein
MPNQPTADIQVENETVEPYRGVMIFRTLQRGTVVTDEETSRSFPPQTFYAMLTEGQLPEGYSGKTKIFASHDVEGVRSLLDSAVPGTGLIVDRIAAEDAQNATDEANKKAAKK